MTTIHELKEAILEMEKAAHEYEQDAREALPRTMHIFLRW